MIDISEMPSSLICFSSGTLSIELRGRLSRTETEYSDALSLAFSSSKGDRLEKFRSLVLGLGRLGELANTGLGLDGPATPSPRSKRIIGDGKGSDDSVFELPGLPPSTASNGGTLRTSFLGLRSLKGDGMGHSISAARMEA